jgi:hypothetical protein
LPPLKYYDRREQAASATMKYYGFAAVTNLRIGENAFAGLLIVE